MKSDSSRPRKALRSFVAQHPTQTAAADALGISRSYLNHILAGRKAFSDVMLGKLGLRRAVVSK